MKNILGIKVTSHDTGAALISGERVVAIAEERLNRVKHSKNYFPKIAIDYCLNTLGVSSEEIDLIVLDQVGERTRSPSERIFKEKSENRFRKVRLEVINHHNAHAASAFFASPFPDSAVLVVDGSGEKIHNNLGGLGSETETLYRGFENKLVEISKTLHVRHRAGFPYTIGIGKLYTFICEAYLNLGAYNEGKMMGLAPYGDDRVLRQFPFSAWFKEQGEDIICNPNIVFEGLERFVGSKKIDSGFQKFTARVFDRVGFALLRTARGGNEIFREPVLFKPIVLEKPARVHEKLPEPYYASVAYAVQKVLEEVMVLWGRKIKAITHSENLCVAGGVGLNIDANKRFLDDVGFKRLFVQPASSDTGIALGCALWGAHMIAQRPRFYEMKSASLGRVYSEDEIASALEKNKDKVSVRRADNVAANVADLIADGKIIAWFQGGSEYGPRALGNRSIIVDARRPDMKDVVNKRVKHRESWRPFAASVLAEDMSEWFDLSHESPFMLLASQVREDKKALVPSIVHVDGTCRIQSVTKEANLPYYELLSAFKKKTGVPLILNTSFNDAGEPIVETPEDALRCFLNTDMDHLILHDRIVSKK